MALSLLASRRATAQEPPVLPAPPVIDDPMLAPPPPAPATIASWDEALSLVRQHTPDYASSYEDVVRARASSREALSQLLPTLTATGSYTHQFVTESISLGSAGAGSIVTPSPDVYEASAILSVPLLNVRGIYAQGTARRGETAAWETFRDTRRTIAVSLVHSMLDTLATARTAELNRVGVRAALERLELTRTKLRFSQGTILDVERAEQDVASARSTLIAGDESLRQSREALGVALGSSVPTAAPGGLDLADFEQAVLRSCAVVADLENRSDIAAARTKVEVADRKVKDAWLQLAPTFGVQAQAAYTSETVLAPQGTLLAEGVLTVPLYDAGVAAATAKDARAQAEQARQALQATRLRALVDIAQATRAVNVKTETRDVARTERDLARSIDLRTREGYVHGLGTSLDLVTSALALRQDEIDLAILQFQVAEARADAVLANADCRY